jgi:adenylyl-sulfate kinase
MSAVRLSPLQLNELELMRLRAFDAEAYYSLPGTPGSIATLKLDAPLASGVLTLLDLESTPVAEVTVEEHRHEGDAHWVSGSVAFLNQPATPAFAPLRPSVGEPPLPTALLHLGGLLGDGDRDKPVIVIDRGNATQLAAAVARASRVSSVVRVLPEPAAHHVPTDRRVTMLESLARSLLATEIELGVAPEYSRGDGIVVLFTGLSGSGKSTAALALSERLRAETTRLVTLLDGDHVRSMLSSELGFSHADRELNVRRIGWVAALASAHGGIAICAPIAPYASSRAEVRVMAEQVGRFVLVHMSASLDVCESRDRKGLYAKARRGELKQFTGISDPYEPPLDADLVIDSATHSPEHIVELILEHLHGRAATNYVI